MRLFIAIDVPKNISERIVQVQKILSSTGAELNFTKPENLHVTLKFLGEVNENLINKIKNEIKEVAKCFHVFRMDVSGIGYFGSKNFIKVIWADISSGREIIIKMIEMLEKRLNTIRKNEHNPAPHLTIARVKSGKNRDLLVNEINKLKNVKFGEVNVKEIKLKKSVLTPSGPIYQDIECFPLVDVNE